MVATVTIILATLLAVVAVGAVGYGVYRTGQLRGKWQYRNSEYVVDYRDIDAHVRHEAGASALEQMREDAKAQSQDNE
jgi:hypothetical protein